MDFLLLFVKWDLISYLVGFSFSTWKGDHKVGLGGLTWAQKVGLGGLTWAQKVGLGGLTWAGYSHYLGWIFPLFGLDISAPCPPYRVLPVPPTDWVVKRDFKSF